MRLIAKALIALVRGYQLLLSPYLPMSCRYAPSCSSYACEALARHGAIGGSWLALRRISRCHPLAGSGYDPVPEQLSLWSGTKPRARCQGHS
ncbi:MAG: membrane protein insertion efficiency factor YidD [Kiloniellales bacterium]